MVYKTNFRIYYEDTDCGGVVYHSNYLKFAERARTEMLRSVNINQRQLSKEQSLYFVVHKIDVRYIKSVKLDDIIFIETEILAINSVSLKIIQKIFLENKILSCTLNATIACVKEVNNNFKPYKIPDVIKNLLKN